MTQRAARSHSLGEKSRLGQGAGTRGARADLGDPAASIAMPVGDPADQLQDDPRPTSEADGDERGTKRWYRQTQATKCGETGDRESERPIVATKRGNSTEGPRGAKGTQ